MSGFLLCRDRSWAALLLRLAVCGKSWRSGDGGPPVAARLVSQFESGVKCCNQNCNRKHARFAWPFGLTVQFSVSAGINEGRRDTRKTISCALANRRLQPLGHVSTQARLTDPPLDGQLTAASRGGRERGTDRQTTALTRQNGACRSAHRAGAGRLAEIIPFFRPIVPPRLC